MTERMDNSHECSQETKTPVSWRLSSGHFAVALRCSTCGRLHVESGREPTARFYHVNNDMVRLMKRLRLEVGQDAQNEVEA